MSHILVGYDDSESSHKALEKAVSLLKENDEIVVVSVVPTATLKEFVNIDPNISKARAQTVINKAIRNLKRRGIKVIGIVREGDIADELLKISKELNCDLIIIGHKGVSKISTFALGSVAEKVVRYATKPVLVIR